MGHGVDVFDRPIRENDAVGGVVIGLVEVGLSENFLKYRWIIRMNPVKKEISCPHSLIGLNIVYSFPFRPERHQSGRWVVCPAAHMRQSLPLKQIRFAPFK